MGKTIITTESVFQDKSVIIANDADSWYYEEVADWKRLNEIIAELKTAGSKAFGEETK